MREFFRSFANKASYAVGSPWAFVLALAILVGWGISGPAFHFSDTWQLSINTLCSIVPTLMVFLIQNTQNRDTRALQLKLDELIRATGDARDTLINLERMTDAELDALEEQFERVRSARDSSRPG